jgi:hypothetical protein
VSEQTVMVDPHDADEKEAQQESNIGWPLLQQLSAGVRLSNRRYPDLENQQRDGNRKHTI